MSQKRAKAGKNIPQVCNCNVLNDLYVYLQQLDLSEIHRGNLGGYYKISLHYKWALTQMFEMMNYNYVVIAEGMFNYL